MFDLHTQYPCLPEIDFVFSWNKHESFKILFKLLWKELFKKCDCPIIFDSFNVLAFDSSKLKLLIEESLLIKRDKQNFNGTINSYLYCLIHLTAKIMFVNLIWIFCVTTNSNAWFSFDQMNCCNFLNVELS